MHALSNYVLCAVALCGASVNGLAVQQSQIEARADAASLNEPYSLPQNDAHPKVRAAAIKTTRAGFLYGPSLIGGPYFPSGPLGTARVAADSAIFQNESTVVQAESTTDEAKATADASKYNGLTTLQDYTLLYQGEWQLTLPNGPEKGVLTNYTSDLLFAMERLSVSPYALRRLNPAKDSVPFTLPGNTARNLTGSSLQQLLSAGRLFYIDYSNQASLPKTNDGKYAAACDALFYIDSSSGNFLPLAIRTNVGSNLIYTPADSANDWTLAKIMFSVNDIWFAQFNHFAQTHDVAGIVYLAAVRTLSESHPVRAVLDRVMYAGYANQVSALATLFTPGTFVDQNFAYTGQAAENYAANRYTSGAAGSFVANYLVNDLTSRGLINPPTGPALSHFPFYEDASVIHDAQQAFMTALVNSYYPTAASLANDNEIQAFMKEANGPAKVINFPSAPLTSKSVLVDILTHMAHLTSTTHHAVNTNELLSVSVTLPLHPLALYQAPPTSKGVSNPASFLPPLTSAINQLDLAAAFSRYYFTGSNRTILNTFNDPTMLSKFNSATQSAAATFKSTMTQFSATVSSRTFDSNGLSQGMPFIWNALDPNVAPFSLTI